MRIDDDHMYHGAAITQIAEHPQFTAINAFKTGPEVSRSGFRVNDDIGVFLKYATNPKPPYSEYLFTFKAEHLDELEKMAGSVSRVFVALVCVMDRQICCLSRDHLRDLVERRVAAKGAQEDQYTILVTLPKGKSFRVNVNAPGVKKKTLGKATIISRNDFPGALFA